MKITKIIILVLFFFAFYQSQAQEERKIIQFSGIVTYGDSLFGVPGVHLYVPKSGRGTSTNDAGYFSMPALENDSVIVSAIGFEKKYIIIPKADEKASFTAIIHMSEDSTTLDEILVLPYPTLQLFKEAFLALKLPEKQTETMKMNFDEQSMKNMMKALAMDGSGNYKYYTLQEIQKLEQKNMLAVNTLLSPTSWIAFFRALKNGDFKQNKDVKKEKEYGSLGND